jgi:exonuclease VII small subunit
MGNDEAFKAKIAHLESRVDFLETEFEHLDRMLREFGFDDGIQTLAEALNEALDVERLYRHRD